MYRKPIFDAVRVMLNRGFTQAEVDALDHACDLAEAAVDPKPALAKPAAPAAVAGQQAAAHVLGGLSERFESGGRGPGTFSKGYGDAGGVSYGTYQLSSKKGVCAVFMRNEGQPWADKFGAHQPGSDAFSAAWEGVAKSDKAAFGKAQHAFIERTMYRPVVKQVANRKGVDLDKLSNAVRDVTWSCAVQHGGADLILINAIDMVERDTARTDPDYDRKLIEAIYKARIAYVLDVASNPKRPKAERDQLVSITKNRYPEELQKALAMLAGAPPPPAAPAAPAATGASIDGNAVARAAGVAVKSANVKISKLHPKMAAVIQAVADCAKDLGLPQPVITSGNDSTHMKNSLHYANRALDFRGNNIQLAIGKAFAGKVASKLGGEYDVAFEVFVNAANNHLHVEYDPS